MVPGASATSAYIGAVLPQAATADKQQAASIRKLIMMRTFSTDEQIGRFNTEEERDATKSHRSRSRSNSCDPLWPSRVLRVKSFAPYPPALTSQR